jgi:hypothetical protein
MKQIVGILAFACVCTIQGQSPASFVGTISGFRAELAQIEIRPDTGEQVLATIGPDTVVRKIAPGVRDLQHAEPISITSVALGDRVLVTLEPGTKNALRIVVMPAQEIVQHNAADRKEWETRGVFGIVSAKAGNRITLKSRTAAEDVESVVTVDDQTVFKRYAPDSVKFGEAVSSRLTEVGVGDQLRAHGEKNEDGLKVKAREVVFGTFLIKAGTVVAVSPESHEISIKELGTNKPLTIAVTPDSQLKQMPAFPPSGGPMPAGRGPAGPGPGGGFEVNQMLERMPTATLADLRPGSQLVVSSTKGASAGHLTAIMVVANADMLIQMAAASSSRAGNVLGTGSLGMGGLMNGDMSGLGLSTMIMQ